MAGWCLAACRHRCGCNCCRADCVFSGYPTPRAARRDRRGDRRHGHTARDLACLAASALAYSARLGQTRWPLGPYCLDHAWPVGGWYFRFRYGRPCRRMVLWPAASLGSVDTCSPRRCDRQHRGCRPRLVVLFSHCRPLTRPCRGLGRAGPRTTRAVRPLGAGIATAIGRVV